MKKLVLVLFAVCAMVASAYAGTEEGTYFSSGLTNTTPNVNAYGQVVRPIDSFTKGGEDVLNDVQKTEERYLTIPIGGTDAMIAADQLYKSGPGYVRSITCYSDATATAGTIALRDNTAAGAGNILWSFDVLAIAYNTPFTVDLQTPFSVGLYLDFTTTADMKCMVRFR